MKNETIFGQEKSLKRNTKVKTYKIASKETSKDKWKTK